MFFKGDPKTISQNFNPIDISQSELAQSCAEFVDDEDIDLDEDNDEE